VGAFCGFSNPKIYLLISADKQHFLFDFEFILQLNIA
jgi:hypothetical protein